MKCLRWEHNAIDNISINFVLFITSKQREMLKILLQRRPLKESISTDLLFYYDWRVSIRPPPRPIQLLTVYSNVRTLSKFHLIPYPDIN